MDIGIIESSEKKFAGYFSFFIPKYETSNFFYIDVVNGNFSKFIIDGDGRILQDFVLTADYPNTSRVSDSLFRNWRYLNIYISMYIMATSRDSSWIETVSYFKISFYLLTIHTPP